MHAPACSPVPPRAAAEPLPGTLAEPDGDDLTLAVTTVFIGPEGGWTPNELGLIASHVNLGKSILRVETAAVVAAANLSALRDR